MIHCVESIMVDWWSFFQYSILRYLQSIRKIQTTCHINSRRRYISYLFLFIFIFKCYCMCYYCKVLPGSTQKFWRFFFIYSEWNNHANGIHRRRVELLPACDKRSVGGQEKNCFRWLLMYHQEKEWPLKPVLLDISIFEERFKLKLNLLRDSSVNQEEGQLHSDSSEVKITEKTNLRIGNEKTECPPWRKNVCLQLQGS